MSRQALVSKYFYYFCTQIEFRKEHCNSSQTCAICTVCPTSLDQIYRVTYLVKCAKTSWAVNTRLVLTSMVPLLNLFFLSSVMKTWQELTYNSTLTQSKSTPLYFHWFVCACVCMWTRQSYIYIYIERVRDGGGRD